MLIYANLPGRLSFSPHTSLVRRFSPVLVPSLTFPSSGSTIFQYICFHCLAQRWHRLPQRVNALPVIIGAMRYWIGHIDGGWMGSGVLGTFHISKASGFLR